MVRANTNVINLCSAFKGPVLDPFPLHVYTWFKVGATRDYTHPLTITLT